MNSPMLLYAVLAIAAGHKASNDEDRHEASEYHGKCLELVIPALSQPESCFDDVLLATIVCLRCYEEFNTQADDFLHLNGTARLLSAIPHFSHSGGLAESASWQALRQDIYVSLIQKQPPTFELDNYDKSSVFNSLDFGAAANVIILLFAKILRCLYSFESNNNYTAWQGLEVAVDQWNTQRVFEPSFYRDAQPESGEPFPTICMISAPQGMKFRHTGRKMLTPKTSRRITVLLCLQGISQVVSTWQSSACRVRSHKRTKTCRGETNLKSHTVRRLTLTSEMSTLLYAPSLDWLNRTSGSRMPISPPATY